MVDLRLTSVLIWATAIGLQAQTPAALTVEADRDSVGLGEPLVLTLTSDEPLEGGRHWAWPALTAGDTLSQGWEVIAASPIDSTASPRLESGLRRQQRLTVMAWDTGVKMVSSLFLNDTTGMAAGSAPLRIEVGLVPLESNAAPKPMQGFKAYQWTWWERLRAWVVWLAAAAALALVARWAIRRWLSRESDPEKEATPAAPAIPAHVTALAMLRELETATPWQRGMGKEAQATLSEAVRLHLQGTFGVKALERTTDEVAEALRSAPVRGLSPGDGQWIIALLERSDLVKFAKQDMNADAHLRVVRESIAWIERTIPEELHDD